MLDDLFVQPLQVVEVAGAITGQFLGAAQPVAVTLLRTGEALPYGYKGGVLTLTVPEHLKAGKVTDVIRVDFGKDFNPGPFSFKHW